MQRHQIVSDSLSSESVAAQQKNSTFAVPIRTSEDGALLNATEGLKEASHVIFWLLLVKHAHKELSVF